jgi:hypothetical protein
MNMKLFNLALIELEQLHWHLHLNGGPDLWTGQLLLMFRKAARDEPADDEVMYLGANPTDTEPPKPAA